MFLLQLYRLLNKNFATTQIWHRSAFIETLLSRTIASSPQREFDLSETTYSARSIRLASQQVWCVCVCAYLPPRTTHLSLSFSFSLYTALRYWHATKVPLCTGAQADGATLSPFPLRQQQCIARFVRGYPPPIYIYTYERTIPPVR